MSKKSFEPNKPLHKQTIVITRASSGIGLATATMAVKRGAHVILCSRNTADLEKIAQELGERAIPVTADVTSMKDLEHVRNDAIAAFGGIDTWVNNAGASIYGPLLEIPEDEERQLFEINFWGVRNGCRVAVSALKKSGGTIINVGSEVSERAIPLQGLYSASKHAVKAYTDALRMELEHDQIPIAVSLIRPTGIDTPFTQHAVNHLKRGAPSLPDPTYHPNCVAEAILKCAVSPQRDVFVGAPAKLTSIMEALMPRVTDRFLEHRMYREFTKGAAIPHTAANEGLMSAPKLEGRIQGGHLGTVKGAPY